LPDDGRFSEDFRDFLCACLQKDPKNRLTCNQLLLHPFLRKAVPEECGIGTHGISGKNSKRQLEAESEAREVQSRGIVELHSILAALHLHFERIQLGISPKSGLQICETSQSHPFFSGLKTARLEDFLRHFLLGNGMVVEESNEVERSVETVLEPNMRPSSSFMDHVNDENKLDTLARQLHLTPDTIKDEIKTYCESLDNGLWKKQMEKPPRRFSRVSTPKASHSGLKESK
jgi:serine/threonine protein kinase